MTSSARAVPFHCPYCADEDLRPHGDTHGEWECRSCMRAFRLSFIGQLSPSNLTTHEVPAPSNPAPSRKEDAS